MACHADVHRPADQCLYHQHTGCDYIYPYHPVDCQRFQVPASKLMMLLSFVAVVAG